MNLTPLMGLPYPNGLDAPCAFDDNWCAFTTAIDAVFDTFENTLARTYPAIPAAVMHLPEPMLVENGNPVPFTDVLTDTCGMTDIDADPYTITIQVAGRYTIGCYVGQQTIIPNPNFEIMFLQGTPWITLISVILDTGTPAGGMNLGNNAHWEVVSLPVGARLQVLTSAVSSGERSIDDAWLAAYWHSDLEVP